MAAPEHHSNSSADFPDVLSPLSPDEIRARLEAAARRGKLPGLKLDSRANSLFSIMDFGRPYESVLSATALREGGHTRLSFAARPKPLMPMVMLLLLVATVWPGIWLTNSMLVSYFPGYAYQTWMWYLPLTVPMVPWVMWSSWRKSVRSAAIEGRELIGKVSQFIEGRSAADQPQPATASPVLAAGRA